MLNKIFLVLCVYTTTYFSTRFDWFNVIIRYNMLVHYNNKQTLDSPLVHSDIVNIRSICGHAAFRKLLILCVNIKSNPASSLLIVISIWSFLNGRTFPRDQWAFDRYPIYKGACVHAIASN